MAISAIELFLLFLNIKMKNYQVVFLLKAILDYQQNYQNRRQEVIGFVYSFIENSISDQLTHL